MGKAPQRKRRQHNEGEEDNMARVGTIIIMRNEMHKDNVYTIMQGNNKCDTKFSDEDLKVLILEGIRSLYTKTSNSALFSNRIKMFIDMIQNQSIVAETNSVAMNKHGLGTEELKNFRNADELMEFNKRLEERDRKNMMEVLEIAGLSPDRVGEFRDMKEVMEYTGVTDIDINKYLKEKADA
jgi:hypothetical protein